MQSQRPRKALAQEAMNPKVGVFVIGVQKCGTTSLASYLAEHPQMLAPRRKEMHFFDNEVDVDWKNPDYEHFAQNYSTEARAERQPYDATPIYIFWPPSIGRILAYNPQARFVVIFRDPVERAYSQWCMEYAKKKESLPFHLAIREGRWRLRGLDELAPAQRVYTYVERGFYGRQVRRLLSQVERERVLFLLSDSLLTETKECLQELSAFLEISAFPKTEPRRESARGEIAYPSELRPEDRLYLRDLYVPDIADFAKITGLDVSDWLAGNPS
jgi:hypothetical protein